MSNASCTTPDQSSCHKHPAVTGSTISLAYLELLKPPSPSSLLPAKLRYRMLLAYGEASFFESAYQVGWAIADCYAAIRTACFRVHRSQLIPAGMSRLDLRRSLQVLQKKNLIRYWAVGRDRLEIHVLDELADSSQRP